MRNLHTRSKDDAEKWRENRHIAYNGSQRHFFTALCEDRLKQEGFATWGVERGRVLGEYHYRVKPADLLRPGKTPDERLLSFPHRLKVVYKNEKNEVDLRLQKLLLDRRPSYSLDSYEKALVEIEARCMQQESFLTIDAGKSLTIATDGVILLGSEARSTFGYWGFDSPDSGCRGSTCRSNKVAIPKMAGVQQELLEGEYFKKLAFLQNFSLISRLFRDGAIVDGRLGNFLFIRFLATDLHRLTRISKNIFCLKEIKESAKIRAHLWLKNVARRFFRKIQSSPKTKCADQSSDFRFFQCERIFTS